MTRTVLIVDDEPNMRWVLGRTLEQAGYTVQSASNGDEATTVLAHEPIDLVLLDLKLKGEDGLHVLRRLRQRRPELVVIILTAYGTVPTAVEAMQLGAADFLRKPFDVEEVVFKIARAGATGDAAGAGTPDCDAATCTGLCGVDWLGCDLAAYCWPGAAGCRDGSRRADQWRGWQWTHSAGARHSRRQCAS